MNKKIILLHGTSSSGNTTICEFFETKNYSCIREDDYSFLKSDKIKNEYIKALKNLKNNYGLKKNLISAIQEKIMVQDVLKSKNNVMFDSSKQIDIIKILKKKNIINKLYIINIFSNLDTLARNLDSRRKEGDSRGIFAFLQFAERYIKTDENDPKKIEKINKNNFIKLLLKYFKYEFDDRNDLITFSNDIFKQMEIEDDEDHYIKVRDDIKYDYLLNTTNKNKNQIFEELEKNVFNNKIFFPKSENKIKTKKNKSTKIKTRKNIIK